MVRLSRAERREEPHGILGPEERGWPPALTWLGLTSESLQSVTGITAIRGSDAGFRASTSTLNRWEARETSEVEGR
jgi:hypothetical protein